MVEGLLKGFPSKAMKLFVAVSPLLHDDDYVALGPILWANCLDETVDSPSTGPVSGNRFVERALLTITQASFLLMQCAERCTMSFMALIEVDLRRHGAFLHSIGRALMPSAALMRGHDCKRSAGLVFL